MRLQLAALLRYRISRYQDRGRNHSRALDISHNAIHEANPLGRIKNRVIFRYDRAGSDKRDPYREIAEVRNGYGNFSGKTDHPRPSRRALIGNCGGAVSTRPGYDSIIHRCPDAAQGGVRADYRGGRGGNILSVRARGNVKGRR